MFRSSSIMKLGQQTYTHTENRSFTHKIDLRQQKQSKEKEKREINKFCDGSNAGRDLSE